jgi:hypothetical protein
MSTLPQVSTVAGFVSGLFEGAVSLKCYPQPGEAGTKNFAGKSESRNSKSETTKNGKCEKKQSGGRKFEIFPRSDFNFVSRFELRILNLEIWCILREISRVRD